MKQLLTFLIFSCLLIAQVTDKKEDYLDSSIQSAVISVTIGGEFVVNGTFPAYSAERVDQFVTRIFTQAKANIKLPEKNEDLYSKIYSEMNDYALRGIKLIRKDGSKMSLDLLRFRLTGDFRDNPYLRNEDVLIFPQYNLDYDFLEISGAVNKSNKFQFMEGDNLSDAIFFARGLNKAYEGIDSAIISRLSYDGRTEKKIVISIDEDFELKRGDRIRIDAPQTNRKNYKVLVLGEVNKPGYVYITKDNTKLKDVIEKAGGFTPNASLKDAQVIRNFNSEQILKKYAIKMNTDDSAMELYMPEEEDLWKTLETLKMYRTLNIHHEDTLFFNFSNNLRILEGTNLVDFTGLDSTNSTAANYIVKETDVIIVPEILDAVYVFGQVSTPGYIKYDQGKMHDYYIEKSGGFTPGAEDDEIYIIKGTNREWISIYDNYEIEPGDYIYVLKDIRRDFWYYVYQIGQIASVLTPIATILLIVFNQTSSSN